MCTQLISTNVWGGDKRGGGLCIFKILDASTSYTTNSNIRNSCIPSSIKLHIITTFKGFGWNIIIYLVRGVKLWKNREIFFDNVISLSKSLDFVEYLWANNTLIIYTILYLNMKHNRQRIRVKLKHFYQIIEEQNLI